MKLFLLKIMCLGEQHYELRPDESSCSAILHALDRYPQACGISARPLGGVS